VGVGEEEAGLLPRALKFYDETGEEAGQDGFHGTSDFGNVENLCVGDEEGALEKVAVRVGKGLQPRLPTLHDTGVGGLRLKKL
jgi:hypothetical protein